MQNSSSTQIESSRDSLVLYYTESPKSQTKQLSLLADPDPSAHLELKIAPVPQRQAIAPNRFLIVLSDKASRRWESPIQLTELETRSLLPKLQKFLKDDNPTDFSVFDRILESAIDGGVA